MSALDFERVALKHREVVARYCAAYGEGSCQHSFASMFCMREKYGDAICERDGWLLVRREKRCTPERSVYLFPMGDSSDADGLRGAIAALLEDAHSRGTALAFETLTERAAERLEALFPDLFERKPCEDLDEYIYTWERLAKLPGHEMADRRRDVRVFWRTYGERAEIRFIDAAMLPEIRTYQAEWLANRGEDEAGTAYLLKENRAIDIGLTNWEALGLTGIAVYIDGAMKGYAYGCPLSEEVYDVIIEKGSMDAAEVYRVLNCELVARCCQQYRWINREEDLGVPGLRYAKRSYHPDRMLKKMLVLEKTKGEERT